MAFSDCNSLLDLYRYNLSAGVPQYFQKHPKLRVHRGIYAAPVVLWLMMLQRLRYCRTVNECGAGASRRAHKEAIAGQGRNCRHYCADKRCAKCCGNSVKSWEATSQAGARYSIWRRRLDRAARRLARQIAEPVVLVTFTPRRRSG